MVERVLVATDLDVVRVVCTAAAAERLAALDAQAQVSLSDERDYALAFVVLSRAPLPV